jgi:hypothetical protein
MRPAFRRVRKEPAACCIPPQRRGKQAPSFEKTASITPATILPSLNRYEWPLSGLDY